VATMTRAAAGVKLRDEHPPHFGRSFTSSYGAENAYPAMSPSPDSSTRRPTPLMKASS
jgi:hypothetical protein